MDLKEYKMSIGKLSVNEQKLRDLHLRKLALGEVQGPLTGYASVDKPWLGSLPEFDYDPEFSKKTIYKMISESIQKAPNMSALDFYGTKLTNAELDKKIEIVAKTFKNLGVKKDEVVFMFCLNTPEMVASMYGLNRIGAVTEWFNPQGITSYMIHKLIVENDIKTIVTIDVLYDILKEAIKETGVKHVIVNSVQDSFNFSMKNKYKMQVFGLSKFLNSSLYRKKMKNIKENLSDDRDSFEKNRNISNIDKLLLKIENYSIKEKILAKSSYYCDNVRDDRFISWEDFINKYYSDDCLIDDYIYDFDRTSIIVHTGGTTGPVKRISMTDYAMNSAVYQSTLLPLNLHEGDKICQVVPPIVAFGLEGHHIARCYNMESHLIATYDRYEFRKIMNKTKANVYLTVPSFAKVLLEEEKQIKDLSYVKFFAYGGESMDPKDDKDVDLIFSKYGSSARNQFGYGQNEEFGYFTVNFDIDYIKDKDYGCCGLPMPGNEFMIVDNDTLEELPYGTDSNGKPYIGELWVTGPTVMKGYIGDSLKENDKTIVYRYGKKYIRTGDQAYIDKNGKLWYYTRNQRIIRTQTGKIFTNLLENIINKYEEVLECCVVAAPNPKTAKEASCHIVLKPEYLKLDENELYKLIDNLIGRLENDLKECYEFYIPGTYEFRSERIPLTSSMRKMDYRKLEELNEMEFRKNNGKALKKIRLNVKK